LTEHELVQALDLADEQVLKLASGAVGVEAFLRAYGDFFDRWALDGHESSSAEMLAKYARRIELHRRVRDEVIYRLTSEEFAADADYDQRGFIGEGEAQARARRLASEYLNAP